MERKGTDRKKGDCERGTYQKKYKKSSGVGVRAKEVLSVRLREGRIHGCYVDGFCFLRDRQEVRSERNTATIQKRKGKGTQGSRECEDQRREA